ncbi:MAG: lactate utilization protein [Pseudomonadota bacterium]
MSDSRPAILDRIRRNLENEGAESERIFAVRERLENHPSGVVPKGPRTRLQIVKLFCSKAKAAGATVAQIKRGNEANAISKYLREKNLPQRLRMGESRRLKRIKWPARSGPEIAIGPSDGQDLVGLSHAFGAIAESGTLVMLSGNDNPTTLNFLPENHIVVVDTKDVVNDHESVWARVRKAYGGQDMPRTINMITGPSRSADIEQTLIMGAHGPVRLHILVVKD